MHVPTSGKTGLPAADPDLGRLRDFVRAFAAGLDEPIEARARLLRDLVARDDWLPAEYAEPDPARYRQYLLHCDSAGRFSVVSFVWGPGQRTPIHDHRVWGLVGVLRGAEIVQPYRRGPDGSLLPASAAQRLEAGEVDIFGPDIGDIHSVANAHADRVSVSIHVYGANIGAVERATYDEAGREKRFVSGYANRSLPNLWDRS
ncbi:cysteine dioxygenase [Rhizorhabdus histidinilytica]|uniref:cysteine dioxygenase family protein n=1 Tax=Rhizorhabdus histidinilytica TaxID=439228 RepID=UPI003D2F9CAF